MFGGAGANSSARRSLALPFPQTPKVEKCRARPRGRCIANSERNFVLVRLGRCGGFRRSCRWFAAGTRLSIFIGRLRGTARPGTTRSAAEQLHRFANDAKSGSFLPSLLVVPGVHLQTAFDENGAALFQIFARDLGQPVFIEGRLQMDTWDDKQ